MKTKLRYLLNLNILFVVLYFSACTSVKPYDLSLHVTGEIDQQSVSQIIEKINSEPRMKLLRINSGGGNEDAALVLSNTIAEEGISIIVDGACISACAHLLLPAAKNVYVVHDSVIGFHSNIYGWLHHFHSSNKSEFEELIDKAENMASFLTEKNANIDILFCVDTFLSPGEPFRRNGTGNFSRNNIFNFFIADETLLMAYGITIQNVKNSSGDIREKLKMSGVSLQGTLSNWNQQECDEAISSSDWFTIKEKLEIH